MKAVLATDLTSGDAAVFCCPVGDDLAFMAKQLADGASGIGLEISAEVVDILPMCEEAVQPLFTRWMDRIKAASWATAPEQGTLFPANAYDR